MQTDLVLSPFGADVRALMATAVAADRGFDGVYTFDHFSGVVAGKAWSRDPFVVLGAIAAVTERARLGVLVANKSNRHPAQLAGAVNSLQSLAPGRVICGIGAGAGPGTQFAAEEELIGRPVAAAETRRADLVGQIATLRELWAGAGVPAVTDGAPPPPIVVGASSVATVELAARHADGVNIQHRGDITGLARLIDTARRAADDRDFEVSVFAALDPTHPLGGDPAPLLELGVDRRTLAHAAPFDVDAVGRIAANLASG